MKGPRRRSQRPRPSHRSRSRQQALAHSDASSSRAACRFQRRARSWLRADVRCRASTGPCPHGHLSPAAPSPTSGAITEPLLAPPLYGRWHAARALVTPGAANWFDELNLDPRWRSAAALGTSVIQQHQEALMASAWEQAAQIQQVNQRMRQLQVSMAVGESLHARHLMKLSEDMTLRFASPAFSRLRMPAPGVLGPTLTAQVMQSMLPMPATQTAMRRIGRQRGPLTRRIAAQGYTRSAARTWVAMLNTFNVPPPPTRPTIVRASMPFPPTIDMVTNAIWNSSFQIAPEGQPLGFIPAVDPLPAAWDYPGAFRAAAAAHLARIPLPSNASLVMPSPLDTMAGFVRDQMRPRVALANLARAIVSTGDNVLPPTAPGVTPIGTESVMMAPSFSQPMYEPLKDQSQDLLLPGLDTVDADSVVGLKTNRAFVEAYLIGLNFEMGRELLWRGFPTDQQGTYFKHFWGGGAGAAVSADIDDLRKNPGRALGTAPPNAPADQFVLLLRSGLLRRYPNAVIYLTPALTGTTSNPPPDVFPMFNGAMDPDVNFFGFPIERGRRRRIGDQSRLLRRHSRASNRAALRPRRARCQHADREQEPSRHRHAASCRRAAQGAHVGQELGAHGGHHAPLARAHHHPRVATRCRELTPQGSP